MRPLQKRCCICGALLGENPLMKKEYNGKDYVVMQCVECRRIIKRIDYYKGLTPERLQDALNATKQRTKIMNLVKNKPYLSPKEMTRKIRIRIYNYHKLCLDRREARYVERQRKAKENSDRIKREQAELKKQQEAK